MRVFVANAAAFKRSVDRAAKQARVNATEAARLALAEAMVEVSETVPVDQGRLAGAYSLAAGKLGFPGGVSGGAVQGDAEVDIDEDGAISVEILTPYAVHIEEGTSQIPAGLQLATAMENARKRVIFGRGATSIRGQILAAFEGE